MKPVLTIIVVLFFSSILSAQELDSLQNNIQNTADQLLKSNSALNIGGYGEVHYNQPFSKDRKELGTLDVHRLVMFLGYNFSSKTQFVSEIEFEYAKELWVEQAFIQHKLSKNINLRAGLMLVPMGIINEYHEPTTFNGVERPIIDNKIAPSTWREIGVGLSGTYLPFSMKYQAYVVGGLNGYDTKGVLSGSKGLRDARQKGSKAYVNSPAFTGKVEYFGMKNLNIGLSCYFGKSQSKLYAGLDKNNDALLQKADSSVVGISMLGADFRYKLKGFDLRGQLYYTGISNTDAYNVFTKINGVNNDLGSQMLGYYLEAGYNVFKFLPETEYELIPFVRYEFYNMHQAVANATAVNEAYKNYMVTSGFTFKLNSKAVLKTDLQYAKSAVSNEWNKTVNMGIGVMF